MNKYLAKENTPTIQDFTFNIKSKDVLLSLKGQFFIHENLPWDGKVKTTQASTSYSNLLLQFFCINKKQNDKI